MNIKITIGVLVTLVVVGAIILINNNDRAVSGVTSENSESQTMVELENERLVRTGTFFDIQAIAEDVECSFEFEQNEEGIGVRSSGVIYQSNNKIRSDSVSSVDGENGLADTDLAVSMIMKDGEVYSWFALPDDSISGVQFNLNELDDWQGEMIGGSNTIMESMNQDLQYSCKPWRADDSVFELPDSVEFVDMMSELSSVMEQLDGFEVPIQQ